MCTFKAYVPESTLLDILNPVLTSRKHLLKVSGHSTKGDLLNNPNTPDLVMCILEPLCLYAYTRKTLATMPTYPRVPVGSFKVISGRRALSKSVLSST